MPNYFEIGTKWRKIENPQGDSEIVGIRKESSRRHGTYIVGFKMRHADGRVNFVTTIGLKQSYRLADTSLTNSEADGLSKLPIRIINGAHDYKDSEINAEGVTWSDITGLVHKGKARIVRVLNTNDTAVEAVSA